MTTGFILFKVVSVQDHQKYIAGLKTCSLDSECVAIPNMCQQCWNSDRLKEADPHRYLKRQPASCFPATYCVCENGMCRYPSVKWIQENSGMAKERCMPLGDDDRTRHKRACLHHVAVVLKDLNICQEITDLFYKNSCIERIAQYLGDPKICRQFEGEWQRQHCLSLLTKSPPELE